MPRKVINISSSCSSPSKRIAGHTSAAKDSLIGTKSETAHLCKDFPSLRSFGQTTPESGKIDHKWLGFSTRPRKDLSLRPSSSLPCSYWKHVAPALHNYNSKENINKRLITNEHLQQLNINPPSLSLSLSLPPSLPMVELHCIPLLTESTL